MMGVNSCACEGYAVPEYNTQNILNEHMYYLFLTGDFDVLLYLQKKCKLLHCKITIDMDRVY
jgi:hypothetical protein